MRHRRAALDARLDLDGLELSARLSKVAFGEPPPTYGQGYGYRPAVALSMWFSAQTAGVMSAVPEIEWARAQGLIVDPRDREGDEPAC